MNRDNTDGEKKGNRDLVKRVLFTSVNGVSSVYLLLMEWTNSCFQSEFYMFKLLGYYS